jgi:N-methylhydantoinase B
MALAGVIPERACPQIYKAGMPAIIYGVNPQTGAVFVDHSVDSTSAYGGSTHGLDGWGSSNASFGNLIKATAEINESIFPTRHENLDYDPDSGGAGRWRGCPGSRYVKRLTAPASIFTYQVGMKYPMPGIAGGRDGAPNRFTLRVGQPDAETITHTANMIPLKAGEAYEYRFGGGGGWGDPFERDPQTVLDDVIDEYVSIEGARRDYGVALTGSLEELTLEVDWGATQRLRSAGAGA